MVVLRDWIFLEIFEIGYHRDCTKGKNSNFLLYYKISSINAFVKGRTCIKYKCSIRRIVETDCVFMATKHFSSRVINGIARYFMRLLLQACSQTDTNVSWYQHIVDADQLNIEAVPAESVCLYSARLTDASKN